MPIQSTECLRKTRLTSALLKSTPAPVLTDTQSKYNSGPDCMGIYSFYTGESTLYKKTQPSQQHNVFLSTKRDSYRVHSIRSFRKTLQHHLTLLPKSSSSEKAFFFFFFNCLNLCKTIHDSILEGTKNMPSVYEYGLVPTVLKLLVTRGYLLSLTQCFLTVLQAVTPRI